MDKTRGRDSDGKIIKAPSPDAKEMIDPFLYQAFKQAVNYDTTWVSTMQLGETLGCWRSTPFSRPGGKGEAALELYTTLKAAGTITWDEKAFYFTHEQGVAARKHYESQVLKGELKANKKSWTNKHAGFTDTPFEDLEKEFPDLYKKATTTYVSKAKKLEIIRQTMEEEGIELTELQNNLPELAEKTGYGQEEILKLVVGEAKEKEETEETTTIEDAPTFSFDDSNEEPSAEELLEEEVPDAEIVADTDLGEEPADVEEAHEEAMATTATESAFDFDAVEVIEETKDTTAAMTEELVLAEPKTARVFADSSLTEIDVKTESITWKGTDGEVHQAFLVEVPGFEREYWLELGLNVIANAEDGKLIVVDLALEETDEEKAQQ